MAKKGLGRNEKKGGNQSSELYQLQVLNKILNGIIGASSSGLATEATLISVLNAILTSGQDIEILLVRDEGNSDLVVQQITDYQSGTPTISYKDVNGNNYTPVGPLKYLDPSAILNLMLSEALDQGLTLDNIVTLLTNLDNRFTSGTITHNTLNTITAGTIAAGSLRGSVFNAGDQDGTWNGTVIPAGVTIPWDSIEKDKYGAIAYDPTTPGTGTNFIIEYTV